MRLPSKLQSVKIALLPQSKKLKFAWSLKVASLHSKFTPKVAKRKSASFSKVTERLSFPFPSSSCAGRKYAVVPHFIPPKLAVPLKVAPLQSRLPPKVAPKKVTACSLPSEMRLLSKLQSLKIALSSQFKKVKSACSLTVVSMHCRFIPKEAKRKSASFSKMTGLVLF